MPVMLDILPCHFSTPAVFAMLTTLLILGVSAVLFVQGRIRSDLVALCSLLCLIMFGILSPEQALSGFSNSIVVMMVGLFVVGGAIFRTGLAKMMGGRIMKLAGRSEVRLLVLTLLVAVLSFLLSLSAGLLSILASVLGLLSVLMLFVEKDISTGMLNLQVLRYFH